MTILFLLCASLPNLYTVAKLCGHQTIATQATLILESAFLAYRQGIWTYCPLQIVSKAKYLYTIASKHFMTIPYLSTSWDYIHCTISFNLTLCSVLLHPKMLTDTLVAAAKKLHYTLIKRYQPTTVTSVANYQLNIRTACTAQSCSESWSPSSGQKGLMKVITASSKWCNKNSKQLWAVHIQISSRCDYKPLLATMKLKM